MLTYSALRQIVELSSSEGSCDDRYRYYGFHVVLDDGNMMYD